MKIMCINISSKRPKKLAEFYELIGISVFVDNGCFDGYNFGNTKNEMTICVWDENKWGKQKGEYITIVVHVDSLRLTYQDLIRKGINVEPIKKTDWGGEQLILEDPDGNIIMFLE